MITRRDFLARSAAFGAAAGLPRVAAAQKPAARTPDVVYVPTPQEVVDAMLKIANVGKDDVLYDLGCGDGRIVVTAASRFGARGVGIDIDPERVAEARARVVAAKVASRVKILQADLFETDFREATVVTLYLLPSLNLKLRPKLWAELKPGTRIVSHDFDMGNWEPKERISIGSRMIYFWTIPEKKP